METGGVVILDVGKTNAKLTLWNAEGGRLARAVRANLPAAAGGYPTLDLPGVEDWLAGTLRQFAGLARIEAIVPVAHGAAAVLARGDEVFAPPLDYEAEPPEEVRAAYERQRDPFTETGSPRLPMGLNLGLQLHWLEALTGPWPEDVRILPWPQFWAWRLSGVAAGEATSLGCHSDLWRPFDGRPSLLAERRGWAARLPPLRRAGEVLGTLTSEWARRTGLPDDCRVFCGLHDSNAALLGARGRAAFAAGDATVLSTGTWFVAMRSCDPDGPPPTPEDLDPARDCLVNVDAAGRPVPSARFMGGREAELIAGLDAERLTEDYDPEALIARLPQLVADGVFVLPGFAPGVGPFPQGRARWVREPSTPADRRAALGLYLALMADTSLDLIGSRDGLLVEGRFAEAQVFVRALATLRPSQKVYVSTGQDDICYGALRLALPDLAAPGALKPVRPLDLSLDAYRADWAAQAVA